MRNDEKKLNDDKCSLISGGNASGIHYIYQCPNCGKGAITACDGNWECECGTSSEKVDEVYLDLDSDQPNYGVPRETMDRYNIPDF
jgi:hypothetical protein